MKAVYVKANSNANRMYLALKIAEAYKEDDKAISYLAVAEEMMEGLTLSDKLILWEKSARIYAEHGRYSEAAERLILLRDHYQRNANKVKEAETLFEIGRHYTKSSRLDLALTYLNESLQLYRALDDKSGLINCLNEIGVIHKDLKNYSEALPLYYEAYETARTNGLAKKLAITCVNIGVVLKNERKFDEALKYYRKAEEIYLIESDNGGLANIYNNIGNIYRQQKKYSYAISNFEKAIEHRNRSGNLERLSYTQNNLGVLYTEKGDYKKAKEYLMKAEEGKLKYHDFKTLAITYINFSELYLAQKKAKQYYFYAKLAEKYAKIYNQFDLLRMVRLNTSQLEAKLGHYKVAYEQLSGLYKDMDTLDVQSQKVLSTVLQAKFSDQQKSSEISHLSELNSALELEKKALEKEKNRSITLVSILLFVLVFLVIILVLLFRNQKALRINQAKLEETNAELIKSTISNEEKETMLKEIHHRVKNNLQIIKSLIRLQKETVNDARIDSILLEFEQRVASMALVHESLYRSKDLASVNVKEYFENLVKDLIAAYNLDKAIHTELKIYSGGLGIDTLIPLGLLTNEIISNALKYAFSDTESGIITVDLKKNNEGELQLIIGDNGIGFDFEQKREESNTLGAELIVALVEQLDGEYEFSSEKGSYFTVKFKLQE